MRRERVWSLLPNRARESPALKRKFSAEALSGALKRSFPRINAGAATKMLKLMISKRLLEFPALKRIVVDEVLSRSAEALLPPHDMNCGGSHQNAEPNCGKV
jgi:hypothetical protein